ncbi:MAG: PilZ domain-containing protein [Pseudomonadales bacterium]|jgi:hypothetical protein|nr:PilZ domain-containing protein [Pseudomonadales bacterium]MDP7596467.1 PilZ domain-containing protein [Pseudomonadales bacterium]HJN52844.1 PilZ domain-containing protein [Pseudomonadales bacterium]|tara:strand:- start:25277 stop:25675 length:399 start_codon:yes stop_codon:yes gene_type:complete
MTMLSDKEDRGESRFRLVQTVFVELQPASRDGSKPPIIVMCNSSDVSANGIQILLHEEIPMGSILRLCVDMKNLDPIFLIGEVKWVQPDAETDGFLIGLLLFEAENTDTQIWEKVIADLSPSPKHGVQPTPP